MLEPVNQHAKARDHPEQRIGQIDPHRILHALDAVIVGAGADVEMAKDAKEGEPEDTEDEVPDEEEGDAREEGDEVDEGGDGGEGRSYFCIDLRAVSTGLR